MHNSFSNFPVSPRKYIILGETSKVIFEIEFKNGNVTYVEAHTLYRIKALRDIPSKNVKAGDLGGYIENESNLSQDGDCWIGDEAVVFNGAIVKDDAHVYDLAHVERAKIYERAKVHDEAIIVGAAIVKGDADIYEHARISRIGACRIYERARIHGYALIKGTGNIHGDAEFDGVARMEQSPDISGSVKVMDHGVVRGNARVSGCVVVKKNAVVGGDAKASGHAIFLSRMKVETGEHYVVISSDNSHFVFSKNYRAAAYDDKNGTARTDLGFEFASDKYTRLLGDVDIDLDYDDLN